MFYDFLEADGYFSDDNNQVKWGKQAAGALIIAEDTKNALILLRSTEVHNIVNGQVYYGNVWGVSGGAVNGSFMAGLKREIREEIGYTGPIKLEASYTYNNHFHNFIGLVPKQFTPSLNWEHDDYLWIEINKLLSSRSSINSYPFIDGFSQFLNYAKNRLLQLTDLSESWFHGSRKDWPEIEPRRFGGIHLGTYKAAYDRLENTPSQRVRGVPGHEKIYEVDVDLKNPYNTPETAISEHELYLMLNLGKIKEIQKKYDGIYYINNVEDAGSLSVLVFDKSHLNVKKTNLISV